MIIDLNETFYNYDRFVSDAKKLAEQYEAILQYVTIGTSHDNRDIILLKLGIGQRFLICCAGVHARETINPVVMLKIIEYYADLYVNCRKQKLSLIKKLNSSMAHREKEYEQVLHGACVYELLQTYTILFVPLLNPDGYMISLKGFTSINNSELRQQCLSTQIPATEWKYNARGRDINRNFPCRLWKAKDKSDYAGSENETKALINLFHQYKASGFLDFHSRGKSIYYYRSSMTENYNQKQFEIARRLQEITNYQLYLPEEEIDSGDTGGNTVHYFSEHFFKPALTIETVEEEAGFPLDKEYRLSTFEEVKWIIFEFGSMII